MNNGHKPPAPPMARRLLAQAEVLVGSTVRLAPSTWLRVDDQARVRGFERLVFVRRLIEYALDVAEEQSRMEATVGVPRQGLSVPSRTRRL